MKKNNTSALSVLLLVGFGLACANSSDTQPPRVTQSNINSVATTPLPDFSPQGKEEKSFTFSVQGGKEITGHVYPDTQKPGGKFILFTPFIEKTDGNLYNAALHSSWAVYGKKRGLFLLEDAKLELDSELGGNAICWKVSNPKQDFLCLRDQRF